MQLLPIEKLADALFSATEGKAKIFDNSFSSIPSVKLIFDANVPTALKKSVIRTLNQYNFRVLNPYYAKNTLDIHEQQMGYGCTSGWTAEATNKNFVPEFVERCKEICKEMQNEYAEYNLPEFDFDGDFIQAAGKNESNNSINNVRSQVNPKLTELEELINVANDTDAHLLRIDNKIREFLQEIDERKEKGDSYEELYGQVAEEFNFNSPIGLEFLRNPQYIKKENNEVIYRYEQGELDLLTTDPMSREPFTRNDIQPDPQMKALLIRVRKRLISILKDVSNKKLDQNTFRELFKNAITEEMSGNKPSSVVENGKKEIEVNKEYNPKAELLQEASSKFVAACYGKAESASVSIVALDPDKMLLFTTPTLVRNKADTIFMRLGLCIGNYIIYQNAEGKILIENKKLFQNKNFAEISLRTLTSSDKDKGSLQELFLAMLSHNKECKERKISEKKINSEEFTQKAIKILNMENEKEYIDHKSMLETIFNQIPFEKLRKAVPISADEKLHFKTHCELDNYYKENQPFIRGFQKMYFKAIDRAFYYNLMTANEKSKHIYKPECHCPFDDPTRTGSFPREEYNTGEYQKAPILASRVKRDSHYNISNNSCSNISNNSSNSSNNSDVSVKAPISFMVHGVEQRLRSLNIDDKVNDKVLPINEKIAEDQLILKSWFELEFREFSEKEQKELISLLEKIQDKNFLRELFESSIGTDPLIKRQFQDNALKFIQKIDMELLLFQFFYTGEDKSLSQKYQDLKKTIEKM